MDEEFELQLSKLLEKSLEFDNINMGGYDVCCSDNELKITDRDNLYFYRSASYKIEKHEENWTLEINYQKKVWRKEIKSLGYLVDNPAEYRLFIADTAKTIIKSFK